MALAVELFKFRLTAAGGGTFAQQYLPELYEAEVERYGNRTLSGFLRMVGAEMPMTSDQVIWSEQNRLHVAYEDCVLQLLLGLAGAGSTNDNCNFKHYSCIKIQVIQWSYID